MLKVIADPGVSDGRVATAGNAFGFCEGKVYTNLEYFVGLYASLHKRWKKAILDIITMFSEFTLKIKEKVSIFVLSSFKTDEMS